MDTIELKGKNKSLFVGNRKPIAINCNFGINHIEDLENEINKIKLLFKNPETTPNSIMDLSLTNGDYLVADFIREEYGIPIGIVPVYGINTPFSTEELLQHIRFQAKKGFSFMTMHFTADLDLLYAAQKIRRIPITSRGGNKVILNTIHNNLSDNVFRLCVDEIAELALEFDFAISLGTAFRPAGLIDACDEIHIEETHRQISMANYLTKRGCKVLMENVGHIDVGKLKKHCELLREANVPIMPLGPLVLDSSVGADHISASIGASWMGYFKAAHLINVITPAEHQVANFSYYHVKEGIKAAKIAAQSVNCIRFPECTKEENNIYIQRSKLHKCIVTVENCTRCADSCPLN